MTGEPATPSRSGEPQPPREQRSDELEPAADATAEPALPAHVRPIVWDACDHVEAGGYLAEWLRANDIPRATWYRWCHDAPALARRFAQARAKGYAAVAEDLLAIADAPLPSGPDAAAEMQRRKLQSDNRKWLLERWSPDYRQNPGAAVSHSVSVTIATGVPGQAPSASRITVESSTPRALPDAGDDDAE